LADLPHGSAEQEGVVHHDPEIVSDAQLNKLLRLLRGSSERLLDEDMLAVLEGGFGQFKVRPDRSHHGDGVDLWRREQLGRLRGHGDVRIRVPYTLEGGRASVTDGCDVTPVEAVQVADNIWTPVAVTDYAEVDHDLPQAHDMRSIARR